MFSGLQLVQILVLSAAVSASILPVNILHARQVDIPESCDATCGDVGQTFQQCFPQLTPSECCKSSFEKQLFNCYECIGKAENFTDFTPPQQTLDQLIVACAEAGSAIDKLTLPGQDPDRPIPTPVPSTSETRSTSRQSSGSQSTSTRSSASQSTVTAPPTSSSTPRSPVTESNSISAPTATDSSSAAQTSQTENTGLRSSGVDLPFMGLASVSGMIIAAVFTLV